MAGKKGWTRDKDLVIVADKNMSHKNMSLGTTILVRGQDAREYYITLSKKDEKDNVHVRVWRDEPEGSSSLPGI